MKTRSAGPDGCHEPGSIIDMDDDRAVEMLNGGYAEPVDRGAATEQAVTVPARRGRKR